MKMPTLPQEENKFIIRDWYTAKPTELTFGFH